MARLRFLAAAADPREGQEGTVYGPGHETDFQTEDYDYIKGLLLDGKAEIIDATPPETIFKAPESPPA
jgi:hypothetical protein